MRAISLHLFLKKISFLGTPRPREHGHLLFRPLLSAQNCSLFFPPRNSRLSADDRNVVAVHCKGGKGRTGTMICILLVEFGVFRDADQSLEYFGQRRTDRNVSNRFQVRGDNFLYCSGN